MKTFRECRYSAFISYAHDDDIGQADWITNFQSRLESMLKARLRLKADGWEFPPMHMSGANGPVAGSLTQALLDNVRDSYAMVIVVHDKYLESDWCLKELEFFKSQFGGQGFLERLYVVAMSEGATRRLVTKKAWADLALPDQLSIPFFRENERDKPLQQYLDNNGAITEVFSSRLDRLLKHLVPSIQASWNQPSRQGQSSPAPSRAPAVPESAVSSVTPPAAGGTVLFGLPSPEFTEPLRQLAEALRARGVKVESVAPESLGADFPEFKSADRLVLAFGSGGEYLAPFKRTPGGHLVEQRFAWEDKGHPADALIWLDLRDFACSTPPGRGHPELVAEVAPRALKPDALLERLAPAPAPALAQREAATSGAEQAERINIYIESNPNETDQWEWLGDRIKELWKNVVRDAGNPQLPPLSLRPRALPLQRLGEQPLDDADGLVLLWGKKTDESLRAQIWKVDTKLPEDPPPAFVAYLIPQQPDPQERIVFDWKVLRFKDAETRRLTIVPDEADRLRDFLERVLKRTMRRLGIASGTLAGAVR